MAPAFTLLAEAIRRDTFIMRVVYDKMLQLLDTNGEGQGGGQRGPRGQAAPQVWLRDTVALKEIRETFYVPGHVPGSAMLEIQAGKVKDVACNMRQQKRARGAAKAANIAAAGRRTGRRRAQVDTAAAGDDGDVAAAAGDDGDAVPPAPARRRYTKRGAATAAGAVPKRPRSEKPHDLAAAGTGTAGTGGAAAGATARGQQAAAAAPSASARPQPPTKGGGEGRSRQQAAAAAPSVSGGPHDGQAQPTTSQVAASQGTRLSQRLRNQEARRKKEAHQQAGLPGMPEAEEDGREGGDDNRGLGGAATAAAGGPNAAVAEGRAEGGSSGGANGSAARHSLQQYHPPPCIGQHNSPLAAPSREDSSPPSNAGGSIANRCGTASAASGCAASARDRGEAARGRVSQPAETTASQSAQSQPPVHVWQLLLTDRRPQRCPQRLVQSCVSGSRSCSCDGASATCKAASPEKKASQTVQSNIEMAKEFITQQPPTSRGYSRRISTLFNTINNFTTHKELDEPCNAINKLSHGEALSLLHPSMMTSSSMLAVCRTFRIKYKNTLFIHPECWNYIAPTQTGFDPVTKDGGSKLYNVLGIESLRSFDSIEVVVGMPLHWVVVSIQVASGTIALYDSNLSPLGEDDEVDVAEAGLTWPDEDAPCTQPDVLVHRWLQTDGSFPGKEWHRRSFPFPQQPDGISCGLYAVEGMRARALAGGGDPDYSAIKRPPRVGADGKRRLQHVLDMEYKSKLHTQRRALLDELAAAAAPSVSGGPHDGQAQPTTSQVAASQGTRLSQRLRNQEARRKKEAHQQAGLPGMPEAEEDGREGGDDNRGLGGAATAAAGGPNAAVAEGRAEGGSSGGANGSAARHSLQQYHPPPCIGQHNSPLAAPSREDSSPPSNAGGSIANRCGTASAASGCAASARDRGEAARGRVSQPAETTASQSAQSQPPVHVWQLLLTDRRPQRRPQRLAAAAAPSVSGACGGPHDGQAQPTTSQVAASQGTRLSERLRNQEARRKKEARQQAGLPDVPEAEEDGEVRQSPKRGRSGALSVWCRAAAAAAPSVSGACGGPHDGQAQPTTSQAAAARAATAGGRDAPRVEGRAADGGHRAVVKAAARPQPPTKGGGEGRSRQQAAAAAPSVSGACGGPHDGQAQPTTSQEAAAVPSASGAELCVGEPQLQLRRSLGDLQGSQKDEVDLMDSDDSITRPPPLPVYRAPYVDLTVYSPEKKASQTVQSNIEMAKEFITQQPPTSRGYSRRISTLFNTINNFTTHKELDEPCNAINKLSHGEALSLLHPSMMTSSSMLAVCRTFRIKYKNTLFIHPECWNYIAPTQTGFDPVTKDGGSKLYNVLGIESLRSFDSIEVVVGMPLHWVVVSIQVASGTIALYDSNLSPLGEDDEVDVAEAGLTWPDEDAPCTQPDVLVHRWLQTDGSFPGKEWHRRSFPFPQQPDGISCGLYAVEGMRARALAGGGDPDYSAIKRPPRVGADGKRRLQHVLDMEYKSKLHTQRRALLDELVRFKGDIPF
eukprot:XP_001700172.1 predicted protein [Chlamydomonas reinhardtii]